jgi:hypothetical protein
LENEREELYNKLVDEGALDKPKRYNSLIQNESKQDQKEQEEQGQKEQQDLMQTTTVEEAKMDIQQHNKNISKIQRSNSCITCTIKRINSKGKGR